VTLGARDLYIVSTDRTELYELLRTRLADHDDTEVILDRRRGERRNQPGSTPDERRRIDRRYYDQAHLLRTNGVILVSRDRRQSREAR
jgi:hypothetical protein